MQFRLCLPCGTRAQIVLAPRQSSRPRFQLGSRANHRRCGNGKVQACKMSMAPAKANWSRRFLGVSASFWPERRFRENSLEAADDFSTVRLQHSLSVKAIVLAGE
ncbi:unnamed protein product [Protopolystoma xenopodis]|uniref:Uncharacterized protein n=1 Tax=Protopolystoma xenopodis TaxID=117903 RepID=A0A3S5ALP7_9PLAT|nr:unnamed protein product [Protopolystoma xenopodis]